MRISADTACSADNKFTHETHAKFLEAAAGAPDCLWQRVWRQRAAKVAPPGPGNVFVHAGEVVDASFVRWLRVGMALKETALQIVPLLEQRVPTWYTDRLEPTASANVPDELRKAAEQAAAARRKTSWATLKNKLVQSSAIAMLKHLTTQLPPESLSKKVQKAIRGGVKLARWTASNNEWTKLVLEAKRGDPGSESLGWVNAEPPARHKVDLTRLHKHLQPCFERLKFTTRERKVILKGAAHTFATTLQQFAQAKGVEDARVLAVDSMVHGVLVVITPPIATASAAATGPAAGSRTSSSVHCAGEGTCTSLPKPNSKCNPLDAATNACAPCRGWAKAIKSLHRKKNAKWRNCVTTNWSNKVRQSSNLHSARLPVYSTRW